MMTTETNVRQLIRRDMVQVLGIESRCFEFPWTEDEFIDCLKQRNAIGMVAEVGDEIRGFMIYELHKKAIHLLNFAVDSLCRREGVGTQMVNRLISKLAQQSRNLIVVEVRESNLDAQLFFRRLGFTAIDVLRGLYEDTDEDAYRFVFEWSGP